VIGESTARALLATTLLLSPAAVSTAQPTETAPVLPAGEPGEPRRTVEIPPGMKVPTVRLTAVRDSVSGVNLFAEVTDFRFAPTSASRPLVPGEGHAFVFVDGREFARVYGPAYHLDRLEPGTHEIKYTLSANDHATYVRHGEEIADSVTIEVPRPPREAAMRPAYVAPFVLPAGDLLPSIRLEVSEDPDEGWNLVADVSGFDFAPENVGGPRTPGAGHAQLYVDGRPVARLYGRAYHLSDLEPGMHRIQVSLIGNDHAPFVHRGEAIATSIQIDVPAGGAGD